MTAVPASTAIKRNRTKNIDADRLAARRRFLHVMLTTRSREFETRSEFVARAAELSAIEDELQRRGKLRLDQRVTFGFSATS